MNLASCWRKMYLWGILCTIWCTVWKSKEVRSYSWWLSSALWEICYIIWDIKSMGCTLISNFYRNPVSSSTMSSSWQSLIKKSPWTSRWLLTRRYTWCTTTSTCLLLWLPPKLHPSPSTFFLLPMKNWKSSSWVHQSMRVPQTSSISSATSTTSWGKSTPKPVSMKCPQWSCPI